MLEWLLIALGFLAVLAALITLIYVLPHGEYRNPDWMAVLLRQYRRQIIAYFVLLAVGATAFLLAELARRQSW
jgi:hypothetical protein